MTTTPNLVKGQAGNSVTRPTRRIAGLLLERVIPIVALVMGICVVAEPAAGQSIERVSVNSDGVEGDAASGAFGIAISEDGRYVSFASAAANLDTLQQDTNKAEDIFLHDRQTGATRRISVAMNGSQGDDHSGGWGEHSSRIAMTPDGSVIVFPSYATNLVDDDTNSQRDVFVYQRDLDNPDVFTMERVSVNAFGEEAWGYPGSAPSGHFGVAVSASGGLIAYDSMAPNLLGCRPDSEPDLAPMSCEDCVLEYGDCHWVDSGGHRDVFVYNRLYDTIERVSKNSDGEPANGRSGDWGLAMSSDGGYVAFVSYATNLVPDEGDTNGLGDIFVHDRELGSTVRISINSDGEEPSPTPPGQFQESRWPSISADGRFVAFVSASGNLVPDDDNDAADVFVHDRDADEDGIFDERDPGSFATYRVSVDSGGAEGPWLADSGQLGLSISADGQRVAFISAVAFDPLDGASNDIYLHDRGTGETSLVSYNPQNPETEGQDVSGHHIGAVISGNGQSVAFPSSAFNLLEPEPDTNDARDVFVFDLGAGIAADLNGDGSVGAADLAILLASWGPCTDCDDCPADLDGDCAVGPADLAILLGSWGL